MRILVADDEPIEREALRLLLHRHMPETAIVGEASTGAEAVDLAERLRPDVILMDIEMPGLSGLEALQEIRERHPVTRCVIVSAYDSFHFAQEALRLGAADYLLKPVKRDRMIAVLQRLHDELALERQRRQDELQRKEHLRQLRQSLHATAHSLATLAMGPWSAEREADIEITTTWRPTAAVFRAVEQGKQYVQSHFAEELSLERVAQEVALTPYYYSKLFSRVVGETLVDYITRVRVEEAKRLLADPLVSIKEACFAVGYNDPNYFSRVFKKVTGQTPTEFRCLHTGPEGMSGLA